MKRNADDWLRHESEAFVFQLLAPDMRASAVRYLTQCRLYQIWSRGKPGSENHWSLKSPWIDMSPNFRVKRNIMAKHGRVFPRCQLSMLVVVCDEVSNDQGTLFEWGWRDLKYVLTVCDFNISASKEPYRYLCSRGMLIEARQQLKHLKKQLKTIVKVAWQYLSDWEDGPGATR